MARNVNLTTSNWRTTGVTVSVPQRQLDVTWEWTDDAGQPHTWQRTVTFPNDLALVPAAWVADELLDLIIRASRRAAGVDDA